MRYNSSLHYSFKHFGDGPSQIRVSPYVLADDFDSQCHLAVRVGTIEEFLDRTANLRLMLIDRESVRVGVVFKETQL